MTDNKRILIGEITTVHGIKGYVKVRPYVEDETLLTHASVTDEKGKPIPLTLKNPIKGMWIAEVKGITDRNEAEKMRGTKLYIDRGIMPETDDGEYYIEDLKDMRVVDQSGKDIGIVLSVENFGASDLIDIKPVGGGDSFYLPFTDDIVIGVDFDNGVITVIPPEQV